MNNNSKTLKITSQFICFTLCLCSISCARLDDNLYNPDTSITEYKWDNYNGEVDFVLDNSYAIPDSMKHEFTLQSKAANESEATKIYAIYVGDTNRIALDTVIMYCHGNKDHMDFYWQRAKLLANVGGKHRFGVLMLDYRGFGMSAGKPTEAALETDVNAGLGWLWSKGLSDDRLVIYGFSMGSAPASKISAKPTVLRPSMLILESPFASAAVMVQDAAKLAMPASYFTDLKIDVAEQIKEVIQPFLWMHGIEDDFLAIKSHGELVYKQYAGKYSEAHRIARANHGDVPLIMTFEQYKSALLAFITR